MNAAHLHLIINHLPIIFPVVGVIVLLTGLVFKSDAIKQTAYLIFILGALSTIAAVKSGEAAEEMLENMAGVSEQYMENHEESAEVFAILNFLLGLFSLSGIYVNFKQMSIAKPMSLILMLFAVAVIFFGKQTATSGGEIRHTEIRTALDNPILIDQSKPEEED
jgi:uncharacterized membrane protein